MKMSKYLKLALVLLALFTAQVGFAQEEEELENETEAVQDTGGKDCRLLKPHLEILHDMTVECEAGFHKYEAASDKSKNTAPLKIGAWNVFNLGSNKQKFKDVALLAELAETQEWDVLAATELFPLGRVEMEENTRMNEYILSLEQKLEQTTSETEEARLVKKIAHARSQLRLPGAVQLLNELRKLDSSWSLIMQARYTGSEGSSALEAGGIYYRSSRVDAIETEFCKALACETVLPLKIFPGLTRQMLDEVVSREPFIASFKARTSKGFDFSIMPFHARFRHPKTPGVLEAIIGMKVSQNGKITFGNGLFFDIETIMGKTRADAFRKKMEAEYKKGTIYASKEANKEILSRYAELTALGRLVSYIKKNSKEKDIIWTGDFNLEYDVDPTQDSAKDQKLRADWDAVLLKNPKGLPGATVLVTAPTSLSDKERLKSNYDHFVLDLKETAECDAATARDVDFIDSKVLPGIEPYLVFLNNEKSQFKRYFYEENEELYSLTHLFNLAQRNPKAFEALSRVQRLGMSLNRALEILALPSAEQTAERKKLELKIHQTLEERLEALTQSQATILKESSRAERLLQEYAKYLKSIYGVFPSTQEIEENGKIVKRTSLVYQQRYPDQANDPESELRLQEFENVLMDYKRRILDSQWKPDVRSIKPVLYQVYREVVSDHIPIEISCSFSGDDD